ncbi:hypothetical protein C7450_116116 [Chelatococcus asaccharovorans]|uniref:Uncharacterized protein n=1 Tax=Chelatococcus asaccharovorans TaxID=28210 RepID=A0A2V3U543_9HYPH|nr:hypothetical protein C7450_116116 [Chelatococcus asaccharovorans]
MGCPSAYVRFALGLLILGVSARIAYLPGHSVDTGRLLHPARYLRYFF